LRAKSALSGYRRSRGAALVVWRGRPDWRTAGSPRQQPPDATRPSSSAELRLGALWLHLHRDAGAAARWPRLAGRDPPTAAVAD